jgi:hypothetical protein
VLVPSFGDEHHDRVRQGAAAHDQHLEGVVQHGGVAAALADDRQEVPQAIAEELRPEEPLTRAHPVDVPAQRVDLAVVGEVAERVRERPGGEGVGAEALMDQR